MHGGAAASQGDALTGWLVGGGALLLVVLAGWLLWRAHINRQRERAYAREARLASEVSA